MFKKFFIMILFVILSCNNSYSQISRTAAMGDLSFSILDIDQSLTPFNFGDNPAWLFKDEQKTFLKITPSLSNSWGSFRPRYESEGTSRLGTAFTGVKTLSESGTFLGYISYNYENRRNYYRSLKKDSYSGEAFYFTDSTKGDFHFTGPEVILMYSFELFPSLYIGGSVNYEILEGLKEIYSYAKTLFRKTGFDVGAAYKLDENLIAAANIKYNDSQESIEAMDVNLLDVEIFNFRGDTYFYPKRGSSVTQKIRKKGFTIGSQFYWGNESTKIGINGKYSPSNTKILLPFKTYSEDEEGYAAFENFDIELKGHHNLTNNLILGIYAAYNSSSSWSRITKRDLMIWKWEINQFTAGIGSTYNVNKDLLVGIEYEFNNASIDSSKYIDKSFMSDSFGSHIIKTGLEYQANDNLILRFGFNYGLNGYNIYTGKQDCGYFRLTCGAGFPLFDIMTINAFMEYSELSLKNSNDVFRKYLSGGFSIHLNTF